jgi:hypothetical protein
MFFTTNSSIPQPIFSIPIAKIGKNPVHIIIEEGYFSPTKSTIDLAKHIRFGMITRIQEKTNCFSCGK